MTNTQEKFHTLDKCLACGSDELHKYLDLGMQPLANALEKPGEIGDRFPLEANFCSRCAHSQLSIAVRPDLLFEHYKYVSGTTETLKKDFAKTANHLIGYVNVYDYDFCLNPSDTSVLDIGSNDGEFLRAFKDLGCKVTGIDPAREIAEEANNSGIPTICDYWPVNLERKFDIITGCNVFAHNLDPESFLKACVSHLNRDGVIMIQMPYGKNTIAEAQETQYYHEHINYFNVSSMVALANRCRVSIIDIFESPVHGGSICFVMQPAMNPVHEYIVDGYMESERKAGLYEFKTYEEFANRCLFNDLELIRQINNADCKVVGYGAAAKTTVQLNRLKDLGLDLSKISYVVDDNYRKVGFLIPGTSISIEHTDKIREENEAMFVVNFVFNFKSEIIGRLKKVLDLNKPNKFCSGIPVVCIEGVF